MTYNAYQDLIDNPNDWIYREDLRDFLELGTDLKKFNRYIRELEELKNSYLYMQGTKSTNFRYNKVRIYNYINEKELRKRKKSNEKNTQRQTKRDLLDCVGC